MHLTQSPLKQSAPSQCGAQLDDGGACPWCHVAVVNGRPLCKIHIGSAAEFGCDLAPPNQTHPHESMGTTIPTARTGMLLQQADAVVYYLGDPATKLVKIGTTTALKSRIRRFRMYRPKVLLLATEPGTYPTERKRHYQFRTLREPLPTGETEWFRKAPVLMEHVGQLRLKYGILCPGLPVYSSWIAPLRR